MKILFLALDVNLGGKHGDTVHVRELARAYRDKGCDVTLIAGKNGDSKGLEDIQVIVMKKYFSGILRFIDDIFAVFTGIIYLGLTGNRMIYERRFSCKIGLAVRFVTRAPLTVEINGLVDDEAAAAGGSIVRASSGWSLRRADHIVAVAPGLAEALIGRYGIDRSKVSVVSNGVDPAKFHPISKEDACNRLSLSAAMKYLCFVGNLVAWYDFSVMLKALNFVAAKYPATRLIIVGDGKERPVIEGMIAELGLTDKILMPGYVAHNRVCDFICASDICLAPFTRRRNENIDLSPVKLFEYLACERPVISSLIGGLERYADEVSSLYLIPPEDPDALAEKIMTLLALPQNERNLEGAEVVRTKYGWSNTAENILAINTAA